MNITVYLGARDPDNPALIFAARELGTWIGANNHVLREYLKGREA